MLFFHNTYCFFKSLSEKCPYSELLWSVFSRIRTEYREMRSISPYLVQLRENKDQNNSEYGHVLRSECYYLNLSEIVYIFF